MARLTSSLPRSSVRAADSQPGCRTDGVGGIKQRHLMRRGANERTPLTDRDSSFATPQEHPTVHAMMRANGLSPSTSGGRGEDFVRSLVTGFLVLVQQPRCRRRQPLTRIVVWVLLVEDNDPPSDSASANEQTNSFPSRPTVSVKPDEAATVRSLAAASRSGCRCSPAQPPNLSSRKHRNDAIHYLLISCLRLHQPPSRCGTPVSKTLRVQGTDWGIDMDEGRDGVIERTKVVGDERG